MIFACLQVRSFAPNHLQPSRFAQSSSVRCLDEQTCQPTLAGDQSLLQSRGAISRAVGSDLSSPGSDSDSVAIVVVPTQNSTESGELSNARFSSDNQASLDNVRLPGANDTFSAGRHVGTPRFGTRNTSKGSNAVIWDSSHTQGIQVAEKEVSVPDRPFIPVPSQAGHSPSQPSDSSEDRRSLFVQHVIAKACTQFLFQTRAVITVAAGRVGLAPFTAELIAIALLILGVFGFMLAAAVLLVDIGNEKQSPVLRPRPLANSVGDRGQTHNGQSQRASTPLGPGPHPKRVIDGPRTPLVKSSPYTTSDISQRSLAPSFERREVAALQTNQANGVPSFVASPSAEATNIDDGEATIYRSAAERAAQHFPQVETQSVDTVGLGGALRGSRTLCPSLIVPAGMEFVFAMPCVLTNEMQEERFNVVDLRGRPLSQVVCHESWSHNKNRIMLETVHNTKLAEVNTQKMYEHPDDEMPEVCKPEGDVFCSLVRDDLPVSYQYILRHVNGQELLNFQGDFHQKVVTVTSSNGQVAAKTERCVANFDGVPHYQVHVAPEVDAGLVLCGLIAIDKVKKCSPPAAAPKASSSMPAGLRDVVRNLQVPRIDQLVPEFRRG